MPRSRPDSISRACRAASVLKGKGSARPFIASRVECPRIGKETRAEVAASYKPDISRPDPLAPSQARRGASRRPRGQTQMQEDPDNRRDNAGQYERSTAVSEGAPECNSRNFEVFDGRVILFPEAALTARVEPGIGGSLILEVVD